jgi:UDP-galactopyranose mutase
MLDHPNIKIMLNADFREVDGIIPYHELVYTGPADQFSTIAMGSCRTARSGSHSKRWVPQFITRRQW